MKLWPLKIALKLLLSKVPMRHKLLRRIGLFKHGNMDDIDYAHRVFRIHVDRAYPNGFPENLKVLELGPGDSVASALIAKAYGASEIWLCDAGSYATQNLEFYKEVALQLHDKFDLPLVPIEEAQSFDEMLKILNTHYVTNGLTGLIDIPSETIDFIWSHSVLEHVRKRDFAATMKQLARVLKREGRISHNVDLQDHLDHSLNNLRFSEKLWESEYFANAGFYTNRIGHDRSLDIFKHAGTRIVANEVGRWDKLPVKREKLAQDFQNQEEDDLLVRTYYVLLEKAS